MAQQEQEQQQEQVHEGPGSPGAFQGQEGSGEGRQTPRKLLSGECCFAGDRRKAMSFDLLLDGLCMYWGDSALLLC